ncbi:hypothetical protein ABZ605_27785 [Streptomyces sp. NPDC012765]|uniref:hypothetical protein n=1 Tax=Streptomyces sp. NPDC012765 TaxID=3155249 RepID=UPI00340A1502
MRNRQPITDTHAPVMTVDQVAVDSRYVPATDNANWPLVQVTRIWKDADDAPVVSVDIFRTDWRNQPVTTHSAMNVQTFIRLFQPAP